MPAAITGLTSGGGEIALGCSTAGITGLGRTIPPLLVGFLRRRGPRRVLAPT
ncbi:hypothetical protein [Actinokineospora sp. NBRC 105648]|uniref:hypothetical protein n=1 Tax=Actinokineospora sp. NBRC 105648 TaxID=3032206 RepID=UPI002553BC0D|nr:hypothetical protein [Actinokineospora sp. NBRC 105648]